MNIAVVTSSFPLDPDDPAAAAGLFVRDFAVALANHGHDIHVLTQDKGWGCKNAPNAITSGEVTAVRWFKSPASAKADVSMKVISNSSSSTGS